ncbi:MAG: FKBP-type peptidyl-prolyl cis-trans isomerase [Gemmatimonadales bacterium]|nr:FKBP-type peptidyl-prolyl cis-trans isomerase [Gemmatimonadales bacterium]
MTRTTLAALLATLAACAGGSADPAAVGEPETVTYAPALGVSLPAMTKYASGLYVQELATGTGDSATAGRTASMRYTGWLVTGKQFDSNAGGAPFEFQLGTGMVIAGWDEGVAGMRVGGRRRLVIPPRLGYGANGAGSDIPGGATLVFDVELLGVK